MTLFLLGIVVAAIIEALHGSLVFYGYSIGFSAWMFLVGWNIYPVLQAIMDRRRSKHEHLWWDQRKGRRTQNDIDRR